MDPCAPFSVSIGQRSTDVQFLRVEDLPPATAGEQVFYCFDTNTAALWPGEQPPMQADIPPGEEHKSLTSLEHLAEQALQAGMSRDGRFVAVGGGVLCDVAALLASLYMRGARLTLVPTTLLAMVDASLGGKTGVDFLGYKNVLGTFYPADTVYIVPELLASLPEELYREGLAEVIKHALLGDGVLLRLLEEHSDEVLAGEPDLRSRIIARSLRVKARYVERDPLEEGERAHLNLGHTFAHALESCGELSSYGHGGAVAWGIARAMLLGFELGITPESYLRRVEQLLRRYGYRLNYPEADAERLADAMERDKKKRAGEVRFVLQRGAGETLQHTADRDLLLRVLRTEL